ncbi:Molybdopterin-guanine dinucleotide biosynthesis protein MobB [Desulfurella amilsii]|uniref:Molybdopterin-guanine dinucleotide biosynthesis protein MobB n=1 Tax=Desulfurella amilsii TaxID=1562698 RepID=A0A1X4XXB8_9BACT|nr:molybdopterin-guanine dinucleotide biosynthesis protein B [Desulfurella amilsii]OSS42173.1 Molybdopterin-guanine dinucleotide biosynthesis protein MobB [Desulfurella amilsii]
MGYVLGVIGHSNVGKTTLIEHLIIELKKDKKIVGAIKHDAHDFKIDYKGKDTYKLKEAGASSVAISSKNKWALIQDVDTEKPLKSILSFFDYCDYVFIEGYKLEDIPKIEVYRSEFDYTPLVKSGIKNVILVVTDVAQEYFGVPTRYIDDYEGIVEFIKHHEHVSKMKK